MSRGLLDRRVSLVHRVFRANKVSKANRDRRVIPAPLALMALKDRREIPDHKARRETPDPLARVYR